MAISRIFVEAELATGHALALDDAAATHVARVLRLRVGETVILFDGAGSEFAAVVSHIDRRGVTVEVGDEATPNRESPLHITLVQAMVSGDKLDWVVQKAVEIGVAAIQPVQCERSVARLQPEKEDRRMEHLRRVAIAACEQCGRNRLPELLSPATFTDWVTHRDGQLPLLLLHPASPQSLASIDLTAKQMEVLIGPEGGFSDTELKLAEARGAQRVRVGPRVLRTETAGLAVAAVLQARFGDWA